MLFRRNKIDLKMINVSSKVSLKLSCLASCKGDIDKASKLYGFLSEGIETIPDFEVPVPSLFEQIKSGAASLYGFVKENKDDIMQAVEFIQSMRGGASVPEPSIPPVPNNLPQ